MKNKEIHTHKNIRNDEKITVLLHHISENVEITEVDYDHKDDYYIFFFLQNGTAKLRIDFKEIELGKNMVFCIMPGQVHSYK